jgi:anti-anti-sigma regulatory factor
MTVTSLSLAELTASVCRQRLTALVSSRSTVVLSCGDVPRLPVRVLALALEITAATGGFLRLEGLTPTTRLALQMVDPDHRLAVDETIRTAQVGEHPYQVRLSEDGTVLVLLHKGIGQHPHMNEAASHEWVRGLDASAVVVDLVQIEHLNSLLVAWLLQLNQGAGVGRCRLVQVGRQAVAQLTQLRLNHLLTIG